MMTSLIRCCQRHYQLELRIEYPQNRSADLSEIEGSTTALAKLQGELLARPSVCRTPERMIDGPTVGPI